MRSIARLLRRLPRRTATSSEGSWPSEKPPGSREERRLRTNLHQPTTMWQSSEADANDRRGSATAAAHNARPCNGLLARAHGFRRRPRPPRFLAIGLAARLLAPRPRVLLVFILARGNRRRFRLLVGDAGLTLQRFAALAFDRADAGGVLGQFCDQFRRHADVGGR